MHLHVGHDFANCVKSASMGRLGPLRNDLMNI